MKMSKNVIARLHWADNTETGFLTATVEHPASGVETTYESRVIRRSFPHPNGREVRVDGGAWRKVEDLPSWHSMSVADEAVVNLVSEDVLREHVSEDGWTTYRMDPKEPKPMCPETASAICMSAPRHNDDSFMSAEKFEAKLKSCFAKFSTADLESFYETRGYAHSQTRSTGMDGNARSLHWDAKMIKHVRMEIDRRKSSGNAQTEYLAWLEA